LPIFPVAVFPLPLFLTLIFCCPFFLPSYFSSPNFTVAQFSRSPIFSCRVFRCPFFSCPFYRCRSCRESWSRIPRRKGMIYFGAPLDAMRPFVEILWRIVFFRRRSLGTVRSAHIARLDAPASTKQPFPCPISRRQVDLRCA